MFGTYLVIFCGIGLLLLVLGTAPSAAARVTPVGIKMDDGYQTLVAFNANPDVSFWEKVVTPPGIDGGDEIPTTTMHNEVWRSMAPRALKTMTPFSMTCAYDPNVYNDILNLIDVETTVTVHFPDGSTLAFYGFLKNFKPGQMEEGKQPEATIEVVPTNADPTTGAEEAPVLTSAPGT